MNQDIEDLIDKIDRENMTCSEFAEAIARVNDHDDFIRAILIERVAAYRGGNYGQFYN